MSLNWRQNVRGAVPEVVARVLDRIQGSITELQTSIEALRRQRSGDGRSLSEIRRELQAGGSAPLNVEGLLGKLGQAQIGGAPSFTSLPSTADPVSKEGALISLKGSPDTIYRFDQSTDPGTWRLIATSGLISIQKNGALVGTRQTVNLIEGSNVTLTVADNPGSGRVDATINASTAAPTGASYITLGTDATLTAERVLTGTANQVILTDAGAGSTLTLSLPQSIATTSTPQFARIGLGAAAHASDLLLLSGASPEVRITDTTASTGAQATIASNIGFVGWTANRDFVSGTIPDSGKASALYYMFVGNGDSHHVWQTGSVNNTSPTERLRLTAVGNLKLAGTAARSTTEGTNHFDIFDGTAPVGTLANGISLYSTAGELRVMDAAGNATLLSPHDKKTNEWIYDSVDTVTGRHLRINMERLMKALDEKLGGGFIEEYLESSLP